MKRIVKFINTCPFSLAPAIWFFSYHRKTRRISRRLAHLFGLVSPQATSRRTAPGRRFSLSACTRVSRRTFSWPETFSWQQPEQRMKSFSLSSSPRWRRRRRGTRRTTPRRRGSLSWIKIPSWSSLWLGWKISWFWIVAFFARQQLSCPRKKMRIESKKTSYVLCYACVYVRIVEVEEYLDAKSDDTMMGVREEKRYSLSSFPRRRFVRFGKPRWQKKRKKRSVQNRPQNERRKFCFLSTLCFWKRRFCLSRDTLFVVGACKKKSKYCSGWIQQRDRWCTNFEGDLK